MDELFTNNNIQNMFAQLGTRVGNDYVPSKNCYSKYNVSNRYYFHIYYHQCFIIIYTNDKCVETKQLFWC